MAEPARPRAQDIYERVLEDAEHELARSKTSLGFSGLFAGFTIGAAPLGMAVGISLLGEGETELLIAALLYPTGYVAVILGRAQFFTENTLYPVLRSFQDASAIPPTARLWLVVYLTNIVGAITFALLMIETPALEGGVREPLVGLGVDHADGDFWANFWSGVVVGWLLALVAWLVEATETATGQFAIVAALTLLVGAGGFDHCIASTVDVFAATLDGDVGAGRFVGWLGTVTLGNIVGGVLIVSMLNYGQIEAERE